MRKGDDIKYGARPLRRTIQQEIEDPLSMEILKRKFQGGSKVIVSLRGGKNRVFGGSKRTKIVDPSSKGGS